MIHLFKRAGLHLALDTGSGAVHLLDGAAYALLSTLPEGELRTLLSAHSIHGNEAVKRLSLQWGEESITHALEEIFKLLDEGLLYGDDNYGDFAHALGEAPVKAMCLHIAHDCNLRCRYCFASTGGFGGSRKLMDFPTAKSAIDLLVRLSGSRHNLEVDFFGGEPLMNFSVVRETVAYARKLEGPHNKNFRFTITTNGLALNDDNIDFINREMGNVVLSIDGRREVNDRMRPRIDGRGSYDAIVPKFQKLVAGRQDKEYYVRGTYTRDNLNFDEDVLQLYELGFDQISVEPVVGPESDDYSIRPQDTQAIEQSYERLMEQLIERRSGKGQGNFNFFHFMVDLDNGPCAIKRLRGCGSGNEYIAVTPDGEIYPCHQFVGQEAFKMGDVHVGIVRTDLKKQFADANLLHKTECQACWAKFFCSGGCNANNHTFRGSVLKPHLLSCELEKIRLECAITLQAALVVQKEEKV